MQQDDRMLRDIRRSFDQRNYVSLSALLLAFLDYLWFFKSEYQVMWPAPKAPRLLYLWSRYFGMATLVAHYCFVHLVLSQSLEPVPKSHCQIWFSFLAVSCMALQCALDAVLVLRLYALYMRNRKIFVLLTPLSIPYIITLVLLIRNILHEDAFTHHCDLKHTPIEAAPLGAMTIVSHLALWFATYSKRNVAEGQAAIVKLVVRGGHWTLAVFFLIPSLMVPYSFASRSVNPFIIFVLPVSLISMISCRILISMRSLKVDDQPHLSNDSAFQETIVTSSSEELPNIFPLKELRSSITDSTKI